MPWMRKYGESKMTWIMMATVPHITSSSGLGKFQAKRFFGLSVPHRTTYRQNNSWVVHKIPAKWLPVRSKMNRPAGAISRDCRACLRNFCQEPSKVNTSCELGIADTSVKCLVHSAQTSSHERIPAAAVAGAESPGSQSSFTLLREFPTAASGRRVCWEAGFQWWGNVSCMW